MRICPMQTQYSVDDMYYNSSIVPTCMLFFSMPPTSIIFLSCASATRVKNCTSM